MLEFTLPQVNGALSAIERRERVKRITEIYNFRIAQADAKGFKDAIRRLQNEDKVARLNEARRKGLRLPQPMSQREQRALRHQGRLIVSDLPERERSRFERERDKMWATIPEHVRAKAELLAGGK